MDIIAEKIIPSIIIIFVFIGVPFIIYICYCHLQSPVFTLRKDDWACSKTIKVQYTTYIKSGAVLLPITNFNDECQQYNLKGAAK
jgi:hypothetical protein